jgi:hypothetical protein
MNKINKGLAAFNGYLSVMFSDAPFESYLEVMFSDAPQESKWNSTESWLYDSNCENYERVWKKITTNTFEGKFSIPPQDVMDYLQSYIIDELNAKDLLAPELAKGKKINLNVIKVWFTQYVQRERFKEGKDALQRTRGARTQSEVMKTQAYERKETTTPYAPTHHIKNLESAGWQIAQVVSKVDTETGHQVGEPDYYVHDDEHLDLEERSENEYMKELLLKRFGEGKVDMYYSLWLEIRYDAYQTKRQWAQARQVSSRVLTQQIEQVYNIIRDNQKAFGY